MKKLKVLTTINCIIIAILGATLLGLYFVPNFDFGKYWYVIVVTFYSVMLYIKYGLFGSDNALWFALCLSMLSGYMTLVNMEILRYATYPIVLVVLAVASLVVYCIYKNTLHLDLVIVFLSTSIPLFLFSYGVIGVWWLVGGEVVVSAIVVAVVSAINRAYNRYDNFK